MKLFKRVIALSLTILICLPIGQLQVNADNNLVKYDHAWAFSASDKTNPKGAKVGEENSFTYEYGVNGKFSLMTQYNKNWSAWTLDGQAPAVAEWYLSGSETADGAIVWTAPRAMSVEISSTIPIVLDVQHAKECDGVGVMVLQQNQYGYAPIWPKAGLFAWYDVKAEGDATLSGVTTKVREGDRLLFVVHSLGENSVGDTVNITPCVQEVAKTAEYPIGFFDWLSTNKAETIQPTNPGQTDSAANGELPIYNHGWAFSNSDKKEAVGAAINDKKVFSYQYGKNGSFQALNKYNKDWDAWTYEGNAPAVSGWYISASADLDGAVVFTAPQDMHVDISSTIKMEIDSYLRDSCDGVGFMVLQQNAKGYAPIWPEKGSFTWYDLKEKGSIDLKGVQTQLKAGEKLLFVTHSIGTDEGDNVNVSPQIAVISSGASYPSKFMAWSEETLDLYQNPTVLSQLFTSESASVGPLSLKYGYDGEYDLMTMYREDWAAWTKGGNSPAIGANFMGAVAKNDAVLIYTAPKTGQLNVKSNIDMYLDWGEESDGASVIVVLKNKNGERPIWPKDGEWEYQKITSGAEIPMKDISVFVEEGNEVHVIVRSTGKDAYDSVAIDPVFDLDTSVTSGTILEAVERVYPTEDDYAENLLDLDGKLDGAKTTGTEISVWVIVAVVGVVIVAVALIVLVIWRKKNQKTKGIDSGKEELK